MEPEADRPVGTPKKKRRHLAWLLLVRDSLALGTSWLPAASVVLAGALAVAAGLVLASSAIFQFRDFARREPAYEHDVDPGKDPDLGGGVNEVMRTYPTWPPEKPSTRRMWTSLFRPLVGESLMDVSLKLNDALERAGYDDYGYYAAPGGFVLVTRPEAIDESGVALSGADRFPNMQRPLEYGLILPSSLNEIKGPNYYRFVSIVVTDQVYEYQPLDMDLRLASALHAESVTALADVVGAQTFTSKHRVEVLIYEFVTDQRRRNEMTLITPSRLPGETHAKNMAVETLLTQR